MYAVITTLGTVTDGVISWSQFSSCDYFETFEEAATGFRIVADIKHEAGTVLDIVMQDERDVIIMADFFIAC
jgi:hypothetical protein